MANALRRLVYRTNELPSMKSKFMTSLAEHLYRKEQFWEWKRRPLVEEWRQNTEAYRAIRRLPEIETMQYVSRGDRGEPDAFLGVNKLAMQLSLATMPKDESWMTVVSRRGEDPMVTNAVRAQQIWMHRKAQTRRIFARHLKQLIVLGTSHLLLQWEPEYLYKRLGTAKSRRTLRRFFDAAGEYGAIPLVGQVRVPELKFNGPRARVMDCIDVLVDPETDILNDRRPGTMIQRFVRPEELEAMRDDMDRPIFTNLEGLGTIKVPEAYRFGSEGQTRQDAQYGLGMGDGQDFSDVSADVIRMFVVNLPIIKWEDELLIDYYFYVAIEKGTGKARMIRAEENPCDAGHLLLLTDHYIDYWTAAAYGMSGVGPITGWLDTKNFIEAAKVNAIAASIWPSVITAAGAFKDVPDWTPGTVNELASIALNVDVIKPMPVPEKGIQIGEMTETYYERKIGSAFESAGAPQVLQNDRETATAVNYKAGAQDVTISDQTEKFTDTLQSYCQWAYDMNVQTAMPEYQDEQGNQMMRAGQIVGNTVVPVELKFDDFKQPRDIEVLGLHGAVNKAQAMQEKREGLGVLGQLGQFLPNTPALANRLAKSYFVDLSIETEQEDWLTPQELAAMDPSVQAMVLENPEAQMQALLQGLNNPMVLKRAMQMHDQMLAEQQAQQQGGGNANPNQRNAQQGPSAGRGSA